MSSLFGRALSLIVSSMLAVSSFASEKYPVPLNLTQGVTEVSQEVYALHMIIFWVCVVIAVTVFGFLFFSIFAHRKSKRPKPADFHESTTVEILWTAVPFIILVIMAIPAARVLVQMEDTADADMTIKITGYQWRWHYDYLGEDVSFFSALAPEQNAARRLRSGIDVDQFPHYLKDVDKPLVVPVGRKIRFLQTSADVIHSWWVPDLALKKDAIPGFINENWTLIEKEGTYRGKCAELCGRDHGYMPVVVEAVSQEKFDQWLAEQRASKAKDDAASVKIWSTEELIARGEGVYNSACVACHQSQGQGIANVFPAITGSAVATGDMAKHIKTVLNGVPGTAMAAYGPQMSDIDIVAVVTYQRNALGNNVGDAAQPSDVAALR